MSLEEEKDFWDLMPHRIKVTTHSKRDNHGRKILDPETARTYRCLFETTDRLSRTSEMDNQTVSSTVYCLPTPITGVDDNGVEINGDATVDITPEDTVEFINPAMPEPRPIDSVERFYDETGDLHNLVVRFS